MFEQYLREQFEVKVLSDDIDFANCDKGFALWIKELSPHDLINYGNKAMEELKEDYDNELLSANEQIELLTN